MMSESLKKYTWSGWERQPAENGEIGSRMLVVCGILLLLVIATALGVVYSSFKSRQLFSELQRLDREAIHLEEDWGRLLLEQSTWASPARIEQLARTRLDMVVPQSQDMVLIQSNDEFVSRR